MLTGFLIGVGLLAQGHPLHLTFSTLDYKTKYNRWELTIKVFSDDFATNLAMAAGSGYVAIEKAKGSEVERILRIWLETRFQIWFDSNQIDFNSWKFEGIVVKDDASWLTYTFKAPLPISEIKIKNSILLDLYQDQKNLFIFTMGQFQSAFEFKNKNQETSIKLNK
jgi:hypothetical protein